MGIDAVWLRKQVLGFAIAALVAVAAMPSVTQPAGWQVYRNADFKFSFNLPGDWTQKAPGSPNIRASFLGTPGEVNNCNMLVRLEPQAAGLSRRQIDRELGRTYTAEDWRLVLFGDTPKNIVLVESRPTSIGDWPAQIGVTRYEMVMPSMALTLQTASVFTIRKALLWVMTCAAGGRTEAEAVAGYRKWESVFMRILGSLVIDY